MNREEAIKKVRWGLLGLVIDKDVRDAFETLIPELKESDDERIRKWLYDYISNCPNNNFAFYGGVGKDAVLNYLEKQKEQKPAEMAQSKSPLSVAYANRCFENGKQAMKEQMLKDAVEGEIVKDITNKLAVTAKGINLDGFKFGQKVRIVVLKAEEE